MMSPVASLFVTSRLPKFSPVHTDSTTFSVRKNPSAGANQLLKAGAKVVPLGRVPWLDARTGEPWDSPIECALFTLDREENT